MSFYKLNIVSTRVTKLNFLKGKVYISSHVMSTIPIIIYYFHSHCKIIIANVR